MFSKFSQRKYDTIIDISLKTGDGPPFELKTAFETEVSLYRTGKELLGEIIVGKQAFSSSTPYAVDMGKFAQSFSGAFNQVFLYLDKNGFIDGLENSEQLSDALNKRLKKMDEDKTFAREVRTAFKKSFTKSYSTFKSAAKKTPFYFLALPPIFNINLQKMEKQVLGKFNCKSKLLRYPERKGAMDFDFKVYRRILSRNEDGMEVNVDFVPNFGSNHMNISQRLYEMLYKAAINTPFKFNYIVSFVFKLNAKGELLENTGYIKEQLSEKVFCIYSFKLTYRPVISKNMPIENLPIKMQVTPIISPKSSGWSVFDGLEDQFE